MNSNHRLESEAGKETSAWPAANLPKKPKQFNWRLLAIFSLAFLALSSPCWGVYQWLGGTGRPARSADLQWQHDRLVREMKFAIEDYKNKLEDSRQREKDLREELKALAVAKDREWQEHVSILLREGVSGVLLIKGNEAQTVLYKQAAIANKKYGFTPLKKDFVYPVQHYAVYKDRGYGLAGDNKKGLFLLVWEPGSVKVPQDNPGYIHAQGVNIMLGKPK